MRPSLMHTASTVHIRSTHRGTASVKHHLAVQVLSWTEKRHLCKYRSLLWKDRHKILLFLFPVSEEALIEAYWAEGLPV
jgi:hypothetical protein